MPIFLGMIGMFGFVGCLIWFIICTVRYDSKKPPLIGMLVCLILFFIGAAMYRPKDTNIPSENAENIEKPSENVSTPSGPPLNSGEDQNNPPEVLDLEDPISSDESKESIQSGTYTLPCGMQLLFYDSVRNDVTGNWRRAGTSSSLVPADYAIEYYEMMFSSEDEIHAVWNATLNTTTKISVSGNLLFVDTFEYVDGEEHDAKIMFSGILLDSQILDLETGEPFEETN